MGPVTTRILVTGATGTLGREVVRVLSRRPRPTGWPAEVEWAVGDLGTGAGIDATACGVDTIIHCASDFRRARKDLPGARASGKRRLPLRLPGAAFPGYRQGGHLTPDHAEGRRTFEEYLAQA